MTEKNYDFRKKLLQIHRPIKINQNKLRDNHIVLASPVKIYLSDWNDEVLSTAAVDFIDFFHTAFGIKAVPVNDANQAQIRIGLAQDCGVDLGEYAVYRGFMVRTDNSSVEVCGHDARGAAQALYYLEDVMYFEGAPAVECGTVCKKPMFSPQMVHSGYGQDEYPDDYLARIAHEGRDAILVFVEGVNKTSTGPLDFNNLIRRASRYGLDVYAYSRIYSDKHPDEPDAEEYYENTYGKLFRECPGLKGVTLVGESVEFPSKDPHVFSGRYTENKVDGIPTGKMSPGWYPCEDYPAWLNLLKKVIRKYNKDADIVFWTYNWGNRPEDVRVKLIESLPTDISLQATFEMCDMLHFDNWTTRCADYSLSHVGPGKYFSSEAKAAKKRGIRLYSMTNTGGRTWDVGVIPYEPMPFQWMRRYNEMRKAHKEWGLCGIMESHHYGFFPSIISKLSKWCFWSPEEDMNAILKKILIAEYGEENYEAASSALKSWSEAITYYTPTDPDQWGAFRVGPSYRIGFENAPDIPEYEGAPIGNDICKTKYSFYGAIVGFKPVLGAGVRKELASLEKMLKLVSEGVETLENAPAENANLDELLNLGRFIRNSVVTGIHAKRSFLLKNELNATTSKERIEEIYSEMLDIFKNERVNVEDTIPLVEKDSRLGWEPSMLYMTDRWHLEWKLRHLDYVLNTEAKEYREILDKFTAK